MKGSGTIEFTKTVIGIANAATAAATASLPIPPQHGRSPLSSGSSEAPRASDPILRLGGGVRMLSLLAPRDASGYRHRRRRTRCWESPGSSSPFTTTLRRRRREHGEVLPERATERSLAVRGLGLEWRIGTAAHGPSPISGVFFCYFTLLLDFKLIHSS
jgi:hypothetical protein